jgi:hypothetical protein
MAGKAFQMVQNLLSEDFSREEVPRHTCLPLLARLVTLIISCAISSEICSGSAVSRALTSSSLEKQSQREQIMDCPQENESRNDTLLPEIRAGKDMRYTNFRLAGGLSLGVAGMLLILDVAKSLRVQSLLHKRFGGLLAQLEGRSHVGDLDE